MKSLRRFFLLMVCACTLGISLASCLGDDDDDNNTTTKTLTAAERAAQISAMQGSYTGYIHFINDTISKEDSISTRWMVKDSTLTVKVPIKLFANGINSYASERHLLSSNDDTVDVSGIIYPYYYFEDPNLFAYSFMPSKVSFTVAKEGKTHEVTATFSTQLSSYTSAYYSVGEYIKDQSLSLCWILLYSVTIDNSTYYNYSPMYVIGKKI